MDGKTRVQIIYTGRVQGVGFRFAATRIAASSDITGYVENLSDGNVKVVAEGAEPELERFIRDVAESMCGNISEVKIERKKATGEFSGFHVRF